MEKHVCSLELSKKLVGAGWKKETEFWWVHNKLRDVWILSYGVSECIKTHPESWEYHPSPLATEILEELPEQINGEKLHLLKDNGKWTYQYFDCIKKELFRVIDDKNNNVSNIVSQMWLYLKKENLL